MSGASRMHKTRRAARVSDFILIVATTAVGLTIFNLVVEGVTDFFTELSRMRDVDQRSLIYDYCGTCNGSFLDAGEFRRYATTSWFGRITRLFGGK